MSDLARTRLDNARQKMVRVFEDLEAMRDLMRFCSEIGSQRVLTSLKTAENAVMELTVEDYAHSAEENLSPLTWTEEVASWYGRILSRDGPGPEPDQVEIPPDLRPSEWVAQKAKEAR